jgi:hypothetical protein
MTRCRAIASLSAVVLGITRPEALPAQRWVSGAELPLVREASALRQAQATDTALASWRATAHGVLRLVLASEPGTVARSEPIKVDELTVTVYGLLPDRVKQVITDWRDTTLHPLGEARYHRDHLGIVSSDFGDRIRLGDGDEVRDLIHPLSVAGLDYYEFALGDTIRITLNGDVVNVVAVAVRPRNQAGPGTVGTLFIDPARRVLARFAFTFTAESYRDLTVRDITVTLESALVLSRHWLPSNQSIVIRRSNNRGIRADWKIRDYVLGDRGADSLFRQGRDSFPAVGGLIAQRGSSSRDTSFRTVLAEPLRVDDDVRAVAEEASAMIGGRSLQLPRPRRVVTGGLFAVNRVQGHTLYPGLAIPIGQSLTATVRGGYGFSDRRAVGLARLEGPLGRAAWSVEGERAMEDVGDVRQYYGTLSFLYPFMSGRDPSDWSLITRGMAGLRLPVGQIQFTLDAGVERSESAITMRPLRNDGRPNPALGAGTATVARLGIGHRRLNGNEIGTRIEIGRGDADWQRISGNATLYHSLGAGRARLSLSGGAGSRGLPGYRHFVLGGSSTLPGVSPRSLGGRSMALADLSYECPLSTACLSGGRRARRSPLVTNIVAPFVAVGRAGGDDPLLPWRGDNVVTTVVGVRFTTFGGTIVMPVSGVLFPFGSLVSFSLGARIH